MSTRDVQAKCRGLNQSAIEDIGYRQRGEWTAGQRVEVTVRLRSKLSSWKGKQDVVTEDE